MGRAISPSFIIRNKMSDKIESHGTCDNCGATSMILAKFKGMLVCQFCLPQLQDTTPEKVKQIEKPIDDFNDLVRGTQNNS